MTVIFTIIFLAAVVGIFKPYINGLTRTHFIIGAVVSFVLIGVFAASRGGGPAVTNTAATNTATDNSTASAPAAEESNSTAAAASSEPGSKWEYSTTKDDMRGTTSKFASVTSENEVDLDFPYGEVHGTVWARSHPKGGLDAAFEVEKGQILCNSFTHTTVSVKFDDKPIQKFECTSASDGSTQIAFIVNAKRFLAELKTAKRTIVEAEFYQKGSQQFIFDTAGLKWD